MNDFVQESAVSVALAPEAGEPRERRLPGGDDVGKLLMVMNGALVGVPAAYAVSDSVAVTLIATVLAVGLVVAHLAQRCR
ncbi:hypothetical protein ACFQS1_38270 [Paractinoplanes rhizophilus]|uniref:Uncharacterized protein n=1 Tax=Paractinoplanes rhizophilus TaxID=1416877 RepID=A0ABW2I4L9_9ACTN